MLLFKFGHALWVDVRLAAAESGSKCSTLFLLVEKRVHE
jgi:hypothetical protein